MKKEMDIIESARLIMEGEENWAQKAYDFMKKKSDKFTDAGWQEAVDAKVGVAIPMSKWTETEKLVKQMYGTVKEDELEEGQNTQFYGKYGKMINRQIDAVVDFVKIRGGNSGNIPYDFEALPDSLQDKIQQIKQYENLWSDVERLLRDIRASKHTNEKEELDENIVDLIDADGHIMVHGKLDSDDGENYVIAGKKYPKKGLRMKVWEGKEEELGWNVETRKKAFAKEPDKQLQWGFDLTNIPAEKWSELVKMFNLEKGRENMGENLKPFSWTGKGIKIITANDPISGEFHRVKDKDNEKGYASYIGLEGDAELVKKAKNFIKKNATQIKDESPNARDFI